MNYLINHKCDSKLTLYDIEAKFSSNSLISFPCTIPALLINISTSPNYLMHLSEASVIASRLVTSSLINNIFSFLIDLSLSISSLVSSSPFSLMSQSVNLEPSFPNSAAIPLPRPEPAPVRKTCRPLTFFLGSKPLTFRNV